MKGKAARTQQRAGADRGHSGTQLSELPIMHCPARPGCRAHLLDAPDPSRAPGRRDGQPVFPGQAPVPGQKARGYLR